VGTERTGRLRRGLATAGRRRGAAAVLVAAALAAAGVLVLALGSSGGGAASGPSSSSATGTVARRTLAERLTATGTIGYAGETTVVARLVGTVTALPAIGDVIARGERLYALGSEPILLLYGSVPAYRTLADGVADGKDVEQLERNLAALGYEPGTIDEEFNYATTEAIIAWQEDLGLEATGELELGRVAFLRGPQRVTKLEATLGAALASASGTTSSAGASELVAWRPESEAPAEVEEPSEVTQETAEELEREHEKLEREKEHKREKKKREIEHEREKREQEKAKSEEAKGKQGPRTGAGGEGGASGSEEGSQGAEGGGGEQRGKESEGGSEFESEPFSIPVMRTSSTRRVVSVELEADQQSIAQRGQKVQVVLPGGAEVPGKVRGLATIEASGGEGDPGEEIEPGVEATISVTGKHRIPALDGATVNVRFTQQVRKHVLSVPLTALIAIGGERFAVYVRGDGARKRILVTPGLAADGYVEVEGKGLRAGMTVETGE
jgi:multidrug efflux pump subunit AcrA (membrane-fusion protein)